MPTMSIDIGTGFYQSDALQFANQRCVNLYPNIPQAPALTSNSLFNVQGLTEIANISRLAAFRNRGGWVFNEVPYFVNGENLYRLDRLVGFDGTVTYPVEFLGVIDGGISQCSFADNGQQLMIINGEGVGFIYNPNTSPRLQTIDDAGFYANGTPLQVVFVDSYFVVTTDDKKAIVSAPNDGLNWNSLDRITAESDPDKIVAPFIFKNQLYLLGTKTTESYNNIGGAGVPFQRSGFFLSQGCSAQNSVIKAGNKVLWVGRGDNEKPSVYMFNGGEPAKVSTTAIDNFIHTLSQLEVESIFSWSYSLRGNEFVAFNIANNTFVFDTTTGLWHERQSIIRDARGVRITKRCRINSVLNAYNELLVGDSEDGRIGIVDVDNYTEYDQPLQSFFTTQPLYSLGNSFSLPKIELLCESGVGLPNLPDPKVRLEISRDGAVFENPRTRELGKIGDRSTRQVWYKNGRVSRFCIFKVTISDAVKRRLFGLEVGFKQGTGGQ